MSGCDCKVRDALRTLVYWKDYKERHGATMDYENGKEQAWRHARRALELSYGGGEAVRDCFCDTKKEARETCKGRKVWREIPFLECRESDDCDYTLWVYTSEPEGKYLIGDAVTCIGCGSVGYMQDEDGGIEWTYLPEVREEAT